MNSLDHRSYFQTIPMSDQPQRTILLWEAYAFATEAYHYYKLSVKSVSLWLSIDAVLSDDWSMFNESYAGDPDCNETAALQQTWCFRPVVFVENLALKKFMLAAPTEQKIPFKTGQLIHKHCRLVNLRIWIHVKIIKSFLLNKIWWFTATGT